MNVPKQKIRNTEVSLHEEIIQRETVNRLKSHIQELSHPSLGGRLAGTEGARKAAGYIANQLSGIGVKPLGNQDYFQKVEVPATRLVGPISLTIGDWRLRPRIDFGEMRLSSGGMFKGPLYVLSEEEEPRESLKGKVVLIPERPVDFDLELTVKAGIEEGIQGLLFEEGDPRWFHKTTAVYAELGIPVIRVRKALMEEIEAYQGETVTIELPLEIGARNCQNVLGFIPGASADITLALTAHYDHLGDDPEGHRFPGALDNGTGVALILELAKALRESEEKLPFNILLGFLTGEESGHWGAKHLVHNLPVPIAGVINLDVLGQNPGLKEIRIGEPLTGHWLTLGTEKILQEYQIEGKYKKGRDDAVTFQSSGINTIGFGEYYLKNIGPRIHTPDDVAASVQYESLLKIHKMLYELLRSLTLIE